MNHFSFCLCVCFCKGTGSGGVGIEDEERSSHHLLRLKIVARRRVLANPVMSVVFVDVMSGVAQPEVTVESAVLAQVNVLSTFAALVPASLDGGYTATVTAYESVGHRRGQDGL